MLTNKKITQALIYVLLCALPLSGFSLFNSNNRGVLRLDWIGIGFVICTVAILLFYSKSKINFDNYSVTVLGFALFAIISSLLNLMDAPPKRLVDFLTTGIQFAMNITLFFVIKAMKLSVGQLIKLFRTWTILGCVFSIYAIYQLFARLYNLPFAWVNLNNPSITSVNPDLYFTYETTRYFRASSIFAEPSYLGAFLLVPLLIIIVSLFTDQKYKNILWGSWKIELAQLSIMIAGFLAALSLGSIIIFVISLVIGLLKGIISKRNIIKILTSVCLLFVLITYIYMLSNHNGIDMVLSRLAALFSPSGLSSWDLSLVNRFQGSMFAIDVGLKNPFSGLGLGYIEYLAVEDNRSLIISANPWSVLFAELGLVGLLVVLGLLFSFANLFAKGIKQKGEIGYIQSCCYLIIWIQFLLAFGTYQWSVVPERWMILGLSASVCNLLNKKIL